MSRVELFERIRRDNRDLGLSIRALGRQAPRPSPNGARGAGLGDAAGPQGPGAAGAGVGCVQGGDRPDPQGRQGRAAQAAPHRPSDLAAPGGRARRPGGGVDGALLRGHPTPGAGQQERPPKLRADLARASPIDGRKGRSGMPTGAHSRRSSTLDRRGGASLPVHVVVRRRGLRALVAPKSSIDDRLWA